MFHNIYQPSFVKFDTAAATTFNMLIEQTKDEMQNPAVVQYELLVSYLKIFLITASRLKAEQEPQALQAISDLKQPVILQSLKDAIERDFKTKHSASHYAKHFKYLSKCPGKNYEGTF